MRKKYDAAAELAIIFIKYVPICFFWMTALFGVLLGAEELHRNWAGVLQSFFIMSVAAVAGTTFIHRFGIWATNKKMKQAQNAQEGA